jgi:hypothetical protein
VDTKRRLAAGAFLTLAVALGAVLFLRSPRDVSWIPCCPFHLLTGLYCPGCGTMRALHEFLHGDLGAAVSFNPMILVAVPAAAAALTAQVAILAGGKQLSGWRMPARGCWVIVAVIAAHWILRNVPAYPFTLLAPH